MKSWGGRLRKQAKSDTKSDKKLDGKLNRICDDFLHVFGINLDGFCDKCRFQKPFDNQCRFRVVYFCAEGARRCFDATSARLRRGRLRPRPSPGRRPFARGGITERALAREKSTKVRRSPQGGVWGGTGAPDPRSDTPLGLANNVQKRLNVRSRFW